MAASGDYEYITINREWRTATGLVSDSKRRPDIIGVRKDKRVDAYEMKSPSDYDEQVLRNRLEEGKATLPEVHKGEVDVLRIEDYHN